MRNRAREKGQVIPLIALGLATLMGFAGVGVDVGFLEYKQQAQQVATDAAAVGGAEELAHTSCSTLGQTGAVTTAHSDALTNGYGNGTNGVTVTANSPPSFGPYQGNNCAISVQITSSHTQTFFTRLFGYASMPETTQAVAAAATSNIATPCIYLLNPAVSQNFHGVNVQAAQCAIYMNDTANFGSGTVNAAAIGYAGSSAPNNNGATFSEATPAPMLPIADPCSTIPGCAYLAANAPSTSGCTSYSQTGWTGTLPSGCYSSLSLNNCTVTLNGLYVLSGNTSFNGSTITGTNTTLYVTSGGTPPNFNGNSVSLAPPSSGNDDGVLYYQVPSNTKAPNFNGSTNSYSGLIYAPTATVNYNATGGGYVVLVFGAINWNGSAAQEFATPAPGQALVNKAVLVE